MANLTQLKILENLNGFLLVDKPAGIAFASVVKAVKRKFNLVKVGHGGALDAMATGLFILLINDANKFVADVMGADRSYEGTMRLGLKTSTGDIHGVPLNDSRRPSTAIDGGRLQAALSEFKGDIFQTEPRFCAFRREGSADYSIVDTGEHTQFLTHIYRFAVGEIQKGAEDSEDETRLGFEVRATKSLIVRALVNDLGDALGCGACLENLRRTRIGKFDVADAIPFDRLLETEMHDFAACVMPLSRALL